MTTEVDDARLELAQLAEQVQRSCSPSRLQLELVPVAALRDRHPDRARVFIARARVRSERVGAKNRMVCLVNDNLGSPTPTWTAGTAMRRRDM